jgi:hypothetical protein
MEGLSSYRLGYVANCLSLELGASHTVRALFALRQQAARRGRTVEQGTASL